MQICWNKQLLGVAENTARSSTQLHAVDLHVAGLEVSIVHSRCL